MICPEIARIRYLDVDTDVRRAATVKVSPGFWLNRTTSSEVIATELTADSDRLASQPLVPVKTHSRAPEIQGIIG